MPEANEGPEGGQVDTAVEGDETLMLEGFVEAIDAAPHLAGEGQPEIAEAVDESGGEETPAPKADTPSEDADKGPDADKAKDSPDPDSEGPDDGEGKPDPLADANFDGLSDDTRTYWEKALKDGHGTIEDLERARHESLFQSAFSKKTEALKSEREAFEAERAELRETRGEDLKLLDQIRADPALHEVWVRMKNKAYDLPTDGDDDDLVDKKTAMELAKKALAEERAAEQAKREEADRAWATREGELRNVILETRELHSIEKKDMVGYLSEEEKNLPAGSTILSIDLNDLMHKVVLRHKAAVAEAKVAALEERANQRASKDERAKKQSLPPARRVSGKGNLTPFEKTNADLGLDPDWSNVTGFGHAVDD